MESTETLRRILGCLPEVDPEAVLRVRAHARQRRLLASDEDFVAGVDESWLATGARGVILTEQCILRYRGDRTTQIAALAAIERVRVRRMWYPRAGLLGRGESVGPGPVIILRFRFDLSGGRPRARLRLQQHAGDMLPFVAALVERAPRLKVAPTLPGL
jgi:hypothetical protein